MAPVSVTVKSGQMAATENAAMAACGKDQIELSVKLGSNDSGCVDNSKEGGAIVAYLKMVLKFLAGGIGITVVLMLVIAGIQYLTSMGDPAQVKKAKERIVNAITALILYVLGYAILSYVVPGGLF